MSDYNDNDLDVFLNRLSDDVGAEFFQHQERVHEQIRFKYRFSEKSRQINYLSILDRALTEDITSNYHANEGNAAATHVQLSLRICKDL